jgi:hypothetical protein
MLSPDTKTGLHAVRERHAQLRRDWQWANPARPELVESRRRQRRLQLRWLRAHLRPASHVS